MMNWSKTHVSSTEGLFPQVSAPSMSLDEARKSKNFPKIDLPTHEKGSLEVPSDSESCSDIVNQGSALLSGGHQSAKNLEKVRQSAVLMDRLNRMNSE